MGIEKDTLVGGWTLKNPTFFSDFDRRSERLLENETGALLDGPLLDLSRLRELYRVSAVDFVDFMGLEA